MKNNRVWIYCRTAHEDPEALAQQRELLEGYANAKGLDIAGTTSEYGLGGTFPRPGIAEVNHAVEKGMADILLIKEPNRLVRGSLPALEYLSWLREKGVRVVCMDGTPMDGILTGIAALPQGRL